MTSFAEGKGTATPWGPAQHSEVIARGVMQYSTAGHGGVSVTVAWARKHLTPWAAWLGEAFNGKLWYEEDCAVCLVFLEHPEFYHGIKTPADLLCAQGHDESMVRKYFPKYFDEEFWALCHANPMLPKLKPGDVLVLWGKVMTMLNGSTAQGSSGELFGIRARQLLAGLAEVHRAGVRVWARPK